MRWWPRRWRGSAGPAIADLRRERLAIVIKTTRRHVETAALAAAAAMLVALVADGLSLLGAPQARVQPQASLRCLLGSVTWAGACGLMMWAVLSGPWAAARSRFGGRWRGLLAAGVPALPLAPIWHRN